MPGAKLRPPRLAVARASDLSPSVPRTSARCRATPRSAGVGKGHLVRELDVFDGLMARAADRAAIHRRMLNRSKGPAVHGPRFQADRKLYRAAMTELLRESGAELIVTEAQSLRLEGGRVTGLQTRRGPDRMPSAGHRDRHVSRRSNLCRRRREARWAARRTRVRGSWLIRSARSDSPRAASRQALRLGSTGERSIGRASSRSQAIETSGPCPRLTTTFACHSSLVRSDAPTSERTTSFARAFDRSPLFAGTIEGRGPRYCPSIEDKVKRFSDRDCHQIFLEPEGLDDPLVYPNGVSTSLPAEVQRDFMRSISGLERVEIVRPGYAVEYEFVDPRRLRSTLETRDVGGLFLAGQINGTTGYEEAAAQGLAAGLNAAAHALDLETVRFDRRTSYIGVMIDDLTIQGVSEPYRMMTARAEYRLALRADNATTRLGERGSRCQLRRAIDGGRRSSSTWIAAPAPRGARRRKASRTPYTRLISSVSSGSGRPSSVTSASQFPRNSASPPFPEYRRKWPSACKRRVPRRSTRPPASVVLRPPLFPRFTLPHAAERPDRSLGRGRRSRCFT